MALDWHEQWGGVWRGFDGRRLAATVVRYDTHGGHWAAFVVQERVEGRHATAEEAKAAAEQAHHDAASG